MQDFNIIAPPPIASFCRSVTSSSNADVIRFDAPLPTTKVILRTGFLGYLFTVDIMTAATPLIADSVQL
ncbi:hypothetical protein TGRH88_027730 [Toxoplasma gondii]|uniref:Uncharacterized protein n=1 Tax=Toxoplasma gondii TaxID=5811 RepID=A0A7J6K9A6_TOXGO|nr:hypothetical protein TGRH88_027730 [Toxoplasma gondii]